MAQTRRTGGTAGEGFKNCVKLVGFLASPLQRVVFKVVSEVLQWHKRWAAFFNRRSGIDPTVRPSSTRVLELVTVQREMLEWGAAMEKDWGSVMPTVRPFIEKERARLVRLQLGEASGLNTDEGFLRSRLFSGPCR